ncbi:MAG: hypothetical protein SynsKO_25600 [Synoicihabitans sp.]
MISPTFLRPLLNRIIIVFCGAMLVSGVAAQTEEWATKNEIYRVAKAPHPIVIDGKREAAWDHAERWAIDHFTGVQKPFDQQASVFRMLWDEEKLYLFFECEDRFLNSAIVERNGRTFLDDCAEIFLIPAPAPLDMHLGLEVNLLKVSNDFIFLTNLQGAKSGSVKSYDPDFEVEVVLDGTLNDNSDVDQGWTMEFAIPLSLFDGIHRFSPVQPGNRWAFQALRQERNDPEIGRRVWSTVFPLPEGSNAVHDPLTFGLLEFVE